MKTFLIEFFISRFAVTVESEFFDFHSFLVTAERECDDEATEDCGDLASPDRSGSLQVMSPDDGVTFHAECINTIVQSEPSYGKRKFRFMWSAPKAGSGCVYLRYTEISNFKFQTRIWNFSGKKFFLSL